MDITLQCSSCLKSLPMENFSTAPAFTSRRGRSYNCKNCTNKTQRDRYQALKPDLKHIDSADPDFNILLTCSRCKKNLPRENFQAIKGLPGSRRARAACKNYENSSRKYYGKKSKENRYQNYTFPDSGFTVEDYQESINKKEQLCFICNNPEVKINSKTNTVQNLSIDHDHESGLVRGLLCTKCNLALGNLGDNIKGLLQALEYLIRASGENVEILSDLKNKFL